jgi:PAS domain S-box-containing protein
MAADPEPVHEVLPATPIAILHLEDSPIDAELIVEQLLQAGIDHRIERVETRGEFVAAVGSRHYDLILSDYALPAFDGQSALAIARDLAPDCPFIFVSGVLGEDVAVESLKRGATDYVGKQRLQRLPAAVLRALDEARRREAYRATQEALRASEERLRIALDAGRLGSWELSLDDMQLITSQTCRANFGRAGDEPFTYAELLQAIHPDDRETQAAAVQRALSGDGLLDVEYRAVWPSGRVRWLHVRGRLIAGGRGAPERLVGVSLDITDRKEIEDRQRLLMAEVDHRAKNMLAVVQAMVRLSRPGGQGGFSEAIEGRIAALARAHTLLARSRWDGADLKTLIDDEIAPYPNAGAIHGPRTRLMPEAAQALAMVFHEMATNAAKYGALSRAGGRVEVAWNDPMRDGELRLVWRESGGPAVAVPERNGVGSMVIRQNIEHQLAGMLELDWSPLGLRAEMRVPAAYVTNVAAAEALLPVQPEGAEPGGADFLQGRRVLVVEDGGVQAWELQSLLGRLGCDVVGPVASVAEGIALSRSAEVDLAVLDIDLRGEKSYPIADELARRGVPYLFSTGFGREAGLSPRFADAEVVSKPFERERLVTALHRLLVN